MKKQITKKKLVLDRTVIRQLTADEIVQVVGGQVCSQQGSGCSGATK